MSILNQSKKIEVIDQEDLPKDDSIPFNKNWKWKEGEKPQADDNGMISYGVIDSVVLNSLGVPAMKTKQIPEEYADTLNGIYGKRYPYPAPSDPLADDEEFYSTGPGMWGVRKKTSTNQDPVMASLNRIEDKVNKLVNELL